MWTTTGTAIVTGATAGFGAAIARRLHGAGAHVVAIGRRRERLDALAAELGSRLVPVVVDVRDEAALAAAVQALPATLPPVEILINNAGLARGVGKVPNVELADWHAMIETNITGLVHMTQLVVKGLAERRRGHIINLGSVAGTYPYPGGNVYGATKAFVRQFSYNLRADLLGTGVRVTSIEPGMAETEFSVVRVGGDAAKARDIYQGMEPLTADDVADAIMYALSTPAHVNINSIELMPTAQAMAGFAVHRDPAS
ncbi:MAG: SDR family NAD(P)-dependent oxidoreductase [Myxococcales bacterium]|nr:SDR family NAD(P)-dependent oxidoreductase [Myxococcales bacterium]